jgi:hypothetical protein
MKYGFIYNFQNTGNIISNNFNHFVVIISLSGDFFNIILILNKINHTTFL